MIISRKKYKIEIEEYKTKISSQEKELKDLNNINSTFQKKMLLQENEIEELKKKNSLLLEKYENIINIEKECEVLYNRRDFLQDKCKTLESDYENAYKTHSILKKKIDLYNSELDMMECGIYSPIFAFDTPESFKDNIKVLQEKQKNLISAKKAAVCHTKWTVNNSTVKGNTMINKQIRLILRAFNGECSAIIDGVRWNNAERCKEKIKDSFERLNSLESSNDVQITLEYLQTKYEKLDLYYGLANLKYKIKEQERTLREERREEERALKALEQERIRAEREEMHYQAVLEKVKLEIEKSTGIKYDQLLEKMKYYESELEEARNNKERAISMAQQTKRGYVYVISNIGSFGENIYKIGMTRRLDPEDRIRELSNASVPFKFDIHAMIYSEDAPALETMLHTAFDEQKVNLINGRKEFFKIELEKIEQKIKESGINADFIKIPEARDYRESEQIRSKGIQIIEENQNFPKFLFDGEF